MLKKICSIILFFLFSNNIFAETTHNLTGKELLEDCGVALDILDNNYGRAQIETEYLQGFRAGLCQGHIMSANQTYVASCHASDGFLDGSNMLKEIALVVKYLKEHKEQLDRPAAFMVSDTLRKYFPCHR